MKLRTKHSANRGAQAPGFTLVEAIVAIAIVGVGFISLYSGLTYGFKRIQFSRENQRATQIMVEKMETIRLYSWAQLNAEDFLPTKFTANFNVGEDSGKEGQVYEGTVKVEEPPDLETNYKDKIKRVTVTLAWKTGSTKRERSFSTYVTESGLYSYIY